MMTATLVVALLAGCAPSEGWILRGVAMAGPSCPVVTEPPDPACADRPVAGARILVLDAAGSEVAAIVTSDDGSFSVELPAGSYQLVPQAVAGLMGTAPPITVAVGEGADPGLVTISYDTGIR